MSAETKPLGDLALRGLYSKLGGLHGGQPRPINPLEAGAFGEMVDLLEDLLAWLSIDPRAPDAGIEFGLVLACIFMPAFRRPGAKRLFTGNESEPPPFKKRPKGRPNSARDMAFMSLTASFLNDSRYRGETPTIADAQRLALIEMGEDPKNEKLRDHLDRVANRKIAKAKEQYPDRLDLIDAEGKYRLQEPGAFLRSFAIDEINRDLSDALNLMDESAFRTMMIQAFKALTDAEFMAVRKLQTSGWGQTNL